MSRTLTTECNVNSVQSQTRQSIEGDNYMSIIESQLYSLEESTLGEFVDYWLENVQKDNLKATSFIRLCTQANTMKNYPIANMPIRKIKLIHIQQYISQLVNSNYAYNTLVKQIQVVTAPLRYAYIMELIDRDVTLGVKKPKKNAFKNCTKEVCAFSNEEQDILKSYLRERETILNNAILFIINTGLRSGEAQALMFEDVDWDRRTIKVCRSVINGRVLSDNGKYIRNKVQDSTKTFSSTRVIPVSTEGMNILKSMYSIRQHGFIFSEDGCEPIKYRQILDRLQRVCRKLKLPEYGVHALRHTFATNCYYKGCDVKVLSKLLGHSSVNMTYNTYINLYGDGIEDMRAVLD